MPYELITQDGKTCVAKKGGGVVSGGCHADEAKAKAHMRALYAAEAKERKDLTPDQEDLITKDLEEKHYDMVDNWVPGGVTSFKDLYAWRETQKESEEIRSTSSDFQSLVSNILWNPDITDKAMAIKALVDEFGSLLKEDLEDIKTPDTDDKDLETTKKVIESANKSLGTKFKSWLTEKFGFEFKEKDEPNSMMLFKQADGTWRWFARYSNKFRDRDNPPEIISSKSHIKFVEKVDKGLVPFPQLWLWHVPDWKWGQGDWVGYDDSGFALASGTVDKGFESLAEALSKLDPKEIRVSHGMPKKSIVRDPDDPTVIVEHETVEISPLPARAAANLLTSFIFLSKEDNMAIPANKREELKKWGIPADVVDSLENLNEAQAKEAADNGIESKEAAPQAAPSAPETPATEVPPSSAPAPVTKDADATPPEATPTPTPTAQEIAEAVSTVLNDKLTAIDERFGKLETALAQTAETVKALAETDEAKIVKAAGQVPAVSYASILANQIRSAIGASETLVDGRSTLAKSKPAETAVPQERPGHPAIWVVNDIIKESESKPVAQ